MATEPSSDVNSALLSLYQCAIDPTHFGRFLATMEAWLIYHATPDGLQSIEAQSQPLWDRLTHLHLAQLGVERRLSKPPIFVLTVDGRPVVDEGGRDWETFEQNIFSSDLTRMKAWLKKCALGAETLIRVTTNRTEPQIYLVRKTDMNEVIVVDTGTELSTSVEQILMDSFLISASEMTVLRLLVTGEAVNDIADQLGKSRETIRSQVKSLAQKMSVNRQQDIQRVVDSIQAHSSAEEEQAVPRGQLRMIMRDAGRKLGYRVYGDPDGHTVVWCNDFSGGSYLPFDTDAVFRARKMKVIVLNRAGYATSDPVGLEGRRLIDSHCADYLAVLDAEGVDEFTPLGMGTGMALAYTLGILRPNRARLAFGLNVYPPVLSRKDALQYQSGMYRVGALASHYAPQTLRVLTNFVIAQAARVKTAKQLLAMADNDVDPARLDDAGSYFREYLKPNLDDILAGKGTGSAADCTYLSVDWAQARRDDLIRPKTILMQHADFPFVQAQFVRDFAATIDARFVVIPKKFRRSHRDVASLADQILAEL